MHGISFLVQACEIPDELILNLDQTAASKVTMAEKQSVAGGTEKRCITATESMTGKPLPLQVICKWTMEKCLPENAWDDKRFLSMKSTGATIDGIVMPYIDKVKKDTSLHEDKKSLLICDAFTGQNTGVVKKGFLS